VTDPHRILIVDDQTDILQMTELVLAGAGYEVATASSGIDALDHLALHRCDLVLLDINMPGMDGWETLRLIRADDGLVHLPVVMFSVKSELRDKIFGMQEGAVDYITKPFEVDQLLYRVRRALDSGHGRTRRAPTVHPEG
jgi:DNA-binding response OmpR family regulator